MREKKRTALVEEIKSAEPIEVNDKNGLTSAQVERQKELGFQNKSPKKVTKTYWQIFTDNLFTFFNMVYFAIAILMIAAGKGPIDYLFLVPVLLNASIGLFSDFHTRHLVDKLRLITNPKAVVVRDSKEIQIDVRDVVLNDVMLIQSGDQICSDGVIISGRVEMDESLLTGESIRVTKGVGQEVLSATYVKSGKAYVRVNAVGIANYAESVQNKAKRFERPRSELKESCLRIFFFTGAISIMIGITMLVTWLVKSFRSPEGLSYESYQNDFVPSISGAMIAMIPAGLYLLVSLSLAISVGRLAAKKMNVQELYCVEMLARVDIICFDKTGTITDANLNVKGFYNYSEYDDEWIKKRVGSTIVKSGDDNQTARCLRLAFGSNATLPSLTIPFDSERKYAAGYFDGEGTIVYGASEFIPGLIDKKTQNKIDELISRGYRVLGVFFSKEKLLLDGPLPKNLRIIGVIAISDNVKSDAKENIKWFVDNGVQVKIISGDNALTVSEIAEEAGVPNASKFISMDNVSDEKIKEIVSEYSVFGRVKPEQKALIISALQEQGHKVAMTGDGVNDILALKKADCSIAMGSGSSAARNVSHIVSVDSDFSKLPSVVAEGRRSINNLQRSSSLFLAKTIFAITLGIIFMFCHMAGGKSYPFTPRNLYVWEICTIGGGGFFLALQHTNDRVKSTFMRTVISRSIPAGLVQVLAVLVIYIIAHFAPTFINDSQAVTMSVLTFTALSYCVLLRICLKLDWYRGIVFFGLLISGITLFVLDRLIKKVDFFSLDYSSLGLLHWVTMVSTFILLIGLYILLDYWASKKIVGRDIKEGGK